MIDEKVIEGLREYLKDHYTPSHNFALSSIIGSVTAFALIRHDSVVRKAKMFRGISDEVIEYIKKHL
jgi:hypothetical protein